MGTTAAFHTIIIFATFEAITSKLSDTCPATEPDTATVFRSGSLSGKLGGSQYAWAAGVRKGAYIHEWIRFVPPPQARHN